MRGESGAQRLGVEAALHFRGPCVIAGRLVDLGAYPGLVRGSDRVVGEFYDLVDARAIETLDAFEDFDPTAPSTSLYLRCFVELMEPDSQHAWVYFYNGPVETTDIVDSGDWRRYIAERNRERLTQAQRGR